jgi:hypothetical protein
MLNLLDVTAPGEIFSGDPAELDHEFRLLARQHHPDVNRSPTSEDEFRRLQELHEKAKVQFELGFWETKSTLRFEADGTAYRARFRRKLDLPIGTMFVGDSHVIFMIEAAHQTLFENALNTIRSFRYASKDMQEEIDRYLPVIKQTARLPQHRVMVLDKTPDVLLLRDIPHDIPEWDRHVAWMISCLHNIRCYLEFAGLTHNDISPDTCFISPEHHSVLLLGGWWYARPAGHKLLAAPTTSYELFGPIMRSSRLADYSLDRELVRALARELLGDRIGTKLTGTAPTALVDWARCTSSLNAIKEYEAWDKVLAAGYGAKKFIPMNITSKSIYGAT